MPVIMALNIFKSETDPEKAPVYDTVKQIIQQQQEHYGAILFNNILPALEKIQVHWLYNKELPAELMPQLQEIYFNEILAFIHVSSIKAEEEFFAENNVLYQVVFLADHGGNEHLSFLNIPTELPRFYLLEHHEKRYVVFIEDIIKQFSSYLFPDQQLLGIYNFKVTRNAEMELDDEVDENMVAMLERKLEERDFGFATRLLCQPGISLRYLYWMISVLKLEKAAVVLGGAYHNLKDLNQFPLKDSSLSYPKRIAVPSIVLPQQATLFHALEERDYLIHVPYQAYDPVFRFFNEAAQDIAVEAVFCTLYRVARPSRIVKALVSAARNGKKVTVLLELKARFDEANNIKWAKELKAAGVAIFYSSVAFKVHAKIALVKRKSSNGFQYLGLLSTGNMNETTARFYTDHMLLTAEQKLLKELASLFDVLSHKIKPPQAAELVFRQLLVAQFNLHTRFLSLIDREMENSKNGLPAKIMIKVNNLEERVLISKLYDASRAGVKIQLLVRGICCLIPGVNNQSENITVKRIVGRYLEHGRLFIFHNNGADEVFMGSADWMNRNIYKRIEVCFPINDDHLKKELIDLFSLQLDEQIADPQQAIYNYLTKQASYHEKEINI
jgi:polyphosphate kinase